MINADSAIQKYIDEKKELQNIILQIIENSESEETNYHKLQTHLDTHQYKENKAELEHFLHLILVISTNHHRQPNFLQKIEKILTITSKLYKPIFSSEELFTFFNQSKPILLILLKSKIITIDEKIFQYLLRYTELKDNEIYYYFYPELDQIIKSGTIEGIDSHNYDIKMNLENFEINRQKGENESKLCSIIREDSIDEFIPYINSKNISLTSHIRRSIFETNSMFIEKDPTLIEYATFFGSIKILKYLIINTVDISPSLMIYAVHSNNAEIISFLEEEKINEIDQTTFSEAIKCHHNDIANYIHENYIDSSKKFSDLEEETILSVYSSDNYEFFPSVLDGNMIFFSLCKNNYNELVKIHLMSKKQEIETFEENKIDVVYEILSHFDSILKDYFYRKLYITKIALPPSIKSISSGGFGSCTNLKFISIPPSVTSIEEYAFVLCTSLVEIDIPSSVTSIEKNAFNLCKSLKRISLPFYLTSIEEGVFNCCKSLDQITIPLSVKTIKQNSFEKCESLRQVIIPKSVTSIGNSSFIACASLTQIMIPSSVVSIGDFAFNGCKSLTQITIPSSVVSIGCKAFIYCESLEQVTIPSSVASFKGCPFLQCTKLENIIITKCNEVRLEFLDNKFLVFKSDPNNDIFDTLLWVKYDINEVIIPPFIKTIVQDLFENRNLLTQVVIPSSVTSIEESSFYNCSSLTQMTIPSSVEFIKKLAFEYCSSLTQVLFENPSSLTSIQFKAFNGCVSLTQITIPSSVKSIDEYAFEGCSSLTQVLFENPSSLTSIGNQTFLRCTSLDQITIPSSVTIIGSNAFDGCSSLTQVLFENPSSVESIGHDAFNECSSLAQISIPSSVTFIGDSAFSQCLSLTQLTIPSSINRNDLKIPENTNIIEF